MDVDLLKWYNTKEKGKQENEAISQSWKPPHELWSPSLVSLLFLCISLSALAFPFLMLITFIVFSILIYWGLSIFDWSINYQCQTLYRE